VKAGRLAVLAAIAALVAAWFAFDLGRFISLEYFRSQQAAIEAYVRAHAVQAALAYFALYVAVTGLSLPGAAILTLAGGAVFGLLWGTVIVSFASSLGATLAFLASRFVLRDWVQARFGDRLRPVNEGIAREGAFYLFALRLVPAFPFFVINLVMGLTPIRTATFYWVSQAGMLAGTVVYVYAGTQLAQVTSLGGILSPGLVGAFVLLGLFPFLAKRALAAMKARRVYARWRRPARFDRNVVVIGAGSAGLVASYIAAAVKAKVTLVERHRMGGDCLNTGCVPSKALIRSAKFLAQVRRSRDYGIRSASADFDFAEVMERVRSVVKAIEPHDSVERYTGLGVEVVAGTARIVDPWTVEIAKGDGSRASLTTRNIVIAAGARPFVPPIPGLAEAGPLTSDNVWELRERPGRLVVLGGGPIGCELAQAFARLGSKVTQVEMLPRLLVREDPEVSELVRKGFEADGIDVLAGHKALRVAADAEGKALVVEGPGGERRIGFDAILVAVGRVANTAGYGLEELGIAVTPQRTVEVNEFLETAYPNILACGDVAGPWQFTHTASHMAWYASVNALFGRLRRFRVDWSVVPWATFTEPEVARVGLNEQEAVEKGVAHQVVAYGIDDLDRAIADGEARGLVKVIVKPGTDTVLGATIVGEHAGDLITEFVTAMRHGIGLNRLLGTIHIYPTLAEANKYAAGAWKRSTVTRGQMDFLAAFHAWTRGEGGFGAVLGRVAGLLSDKRPYHDASRH
jgi:pyruvate/2-oxoglutarate dehydrogenase complex dihydrolipoamide dehydrogenase (E3) component/uncharacterized membrane protein YdjX (TVP38/TMEM64 family)